MNFRELNCKDIDFESWICGNNNNNNNNNNNKWTLRNWTARVQIFNNNHNNNNKKWTLGNWIARI